MLGDVGQGEGGAGQARPLDRVDAVLPLLVDAVDEAIAAHRDRGAQGRDPADAGQEVGDLRRLPGGDVLVENGTIKEIGEQLKKNLGPGSDFEKAMKDRTAKPGGDDAPKPPTDDPGDFQNAGGPGTPVSLTFLGNLYGEAKLLAFARAYQEATGFHRKHPQL